MRSTRYWWFVVLLFLASNRTVAQKKEVLNEQVEVIRAYKPVLGDVSKLKKSPSFFDETAGKPVVDYSYKDLQLKKDSAHNSIAPDTLSAKDSATYPSLYLKAGGGNLQTFLGDIYLSSRPNATSLWGAWFNHLSEQGKLANQKFLKEIAVIHGKKTFGSSYLSGNFNASEHVVHFYGYDHSKLSLSSGNTRQSLRNIEAEAEFASLPDSTAGFLYSLKFKGYNFLDSYTSKEDHYQASGHIGYTVLNLLSFNLAGQIVYNKQQQETGIAYNNSIVRIEPSITLGTKYVRVKAGLNLVSDIGDNHRIQILPDLSADLLLDYGFNIFGGVKEDVIQNTFRGFTDENPWLRGVPFPVHPTVRSLLVIPSYIPYALYNTRQNFFFFAGIKGAFSKEFNYRVQVEAGTYDNLPFFAASPVDNRYFVVVYDGKGTTREKVIAELNYLPSDRLRIEANLNYVSFKLKNLPEPWHIPKWQSDFELHYMISTKFLLHTGLNYSGKRPSYSTDNAGNVSKVTLGSYTDVNLGAEYRFSKKFSLFIQGSNLLNKVYENYINYTVMGIAIRGGLTLSF